MACPSPPAMASSSLRPGVLVKLLQDMDSSTTKSPRHRLCRPPSLLQVTGIIPVLSRTGLSPDGGFHIEVSDSSQSIYVSLPPDETDHILTDRLQVGQLIHVRGLRPSYPVPVLHGLRLLPGRRCLSSPVSRPPSSPRKAIMQRTWTMPAGRSASRKRQEPGRRRSDGPDKPAKIKAACADGESEEEESTLSLASSSSCSFSSSTASSGGMTPRSARRKSWVSLCGFEEETAQGIRSLGRSQSVRISRSEAIDRYTPATPKNDNWDHEQLAGRRRRRDASRGLVCSCSVKEKLCESYRVSNDDEPFIKSPCESIHLGSSIGMKWQEKNVIDWASLPSSLLNHGKELLKQRESALNAAVDALLEASVSERLLQCLSVYSEIQADMAATPSKLVAKFLILYRDLSEARSLAKSLSKPPELSSIVRTAAALERKKRAASWIRAALESDLSQFPDTTKSPANADAIELSAAGRRSAPLAAAANLAGALHSECTRWFLRYVERFLDAVDVVRDDVARRGGGCCETSGSVAGLFCQLKRIDDWLDQAVMDGARRRDVGHGRFGEEEEEAKACERVRKKMYRVLLNHAEYAATALENIGQADQDMQRTRRLKMHS